MNRRDTWKLLALLASGCGGRIWGDDPNRALLPVAPGKKVLVIGAGMAGLGAAQVLRESGFEVKVIEARDSPGGRTRTSHQWADCPVDLGAGWIHGVKGNPLTTLADRARATRKVTSYDRSEIYNSNGHPLSPSQERLMRQLRKMIDSAIERAGDRERDLSITQALKPVLDEYRNRVHESEFISFLINSEIEHEYAGSADVTSAHWYDESEIFDGPDAILLEGFTSLVNHLIRNLDIRTGEPVESIDWRESPVRVRTRKAEYVADHVVITVPLGVLKKRSIGFIPDLPARKVAAIDRLGMGVLNKCFLRFPKVFWPDHVDWLEFVAPRHGEWTEWVNMARTTGKPVLIGFNAAERGREIEEWTDDEIVASAMMTLKGIFGQDIPGPVGHQITRWASDPWSCGSYSFNAVGSVPEMRDTLAEPLASRIHFAGEATERKYFGTAHGAYLSGLRAAREISVIAANHRR